LPPLLRLRCGPMQAAWQPTHGQALVASLHHDALGLYVTLHPPMCLVHCMFTTGPSHFHEKQQELLEAQQEAAGFAATPRPMQVAWQPTLCTSTCGLAAPECSVPLCHFACTWVPCSLHAGP
jgi:hypothetical protein